MLPTSTVVKLLQFSTSVCHFMFQIVNWTFSIFSFAWCLTSTGLTVLCKMNNIMQMQLWKLTNRDCCFNSKKSVKKTGNGFPILFKASNISLLQLFFLCDRDKGIFGIGQWRSNYKNRTLMCFLTYMTKALKVWNALKTWIHELDVLRAKNYDSMITFSLPIRNGCRPRLIIFVPELWLSGHAMGTWYS